MKKLWLFYLLLFLTLSCSKNDDKKYHIGIIQLVQHPALDASTKGFIDKLNELLPNEIDFDIQNASGDSSTCITIANSFVANNKDLVLANATSSLQAMASSTSTIPILGTSITDYSVALKLNVKNGTTGVNVSGTTDLSPLEEQADIITELFPKCKKVGIVYCSAEPNSLYQVKIIKSHLKKKNIETKEFSFADLNEISPVMENACQYSDVIYVPTDNTVASASSAINNVALTKKVPIVAGEEGIAKGCGVATLSISYYELGQLTGQMAYKILEEGQDISKMPIQVAAKTEKKYNPTNAKILNIFIPSDYKSL